MTTSSFFAGIAQDDVALRSVHTKVPLFYRRMSFFSGLFLCDLEYARTLLPTPQHHAIAALPGRAVAALQCFEYADCDIGPYNEVALSIAVQHGRRPRLGPDKLLWAAVTGTFQGFVVDLPVNTEVALWGGLDFFNYPKYLADISFEDDPRSRTCTLRERDSGARILSAHLNKPWARSPTRRLLAGKTLRFVSYPRKDGTTLRAEMRVRLLECAISLGPRGLDLELDAHPRADLLRGLRLTGPLQVLWAPRCEAILALPAPVRGGA